MDESEVMTVLPKELRLGAPPTMPQARSYLYRQQSTLSSYNPENQIQINIPRLQRSYLKKDSYLQFRLNGQYQPEALNTVSNQNEICPDLFLDDAGAWGLFERIEVFDYLGSTVLESLDGLPQLMSLLIDMGTDFTDPDHEGAISHGLSAPYVNIQTADSSFANVVPGNAEIGLPVSGLTTANNFRYQFAGGAVQTLTVTATLVAAQAGSTIDSWLAAVNVFLKSEAVTATTGGFYVKLSDDGKQFDLVHPSKSFTLPSGLTAENLFLTKLGITTLPKTSAAGTGQVITTMGVGRATYTGGSHLAANGNTLANTPREFSIQYSIPLPSFLGFLSKKMVPLHNGFTIVLTIANKFKPMFMAVKQLPIVAFVPTDAGTTANFDVPVDTVAYNTIEPIAGQNNINKPGNMGTPVVFWWNLSDVSLVCQILELGPAAESMLLSTSQGQPLILHTKQLRYYRGGVTSTAGEFNLPLNLNVASLTNILWFMRPDTVDANLNYASVGNRLRNYLQRWEMQYGSTILPQSNGIQAMYMGSPDLPSGQTLTGEFRPAGFTECYNELVKSRSCIPIRGRLSPYNYSQIGYAGFGNVYGFGVTPFRCLNATTITPRGDTGKFACGLNLELASGKTGDLICGLNTNGMNTQIRGYFHPSFVVNNDKLAAIIDAYAEYDAFINISPGIATTVSF